MIPVTGPSGAAAFLMKGRLGMDVILHIGAHRTGTTTFQRYMRDQTDYLERHAIGFWGPHRTRKSVFPGLFRGGGIGRVENTAFRAAGRVALQMHGAEQRGARHLLVSDENMLGTARYNLRSGALYPAAGERMARLCDAFRGRISRVVMSVRSQDHWWASAAAMTVGRGHPVPSAQRCEMIANDTRSWRDVITDLACALPDAEIRVLPFEQHMGRPQDILYQATDRRAPIDPKHLWLNRSPDLARLRDVMAQQGGDITQLPQGQGRWLPFSHEQSAQLREAYADDMFWLTAGADGLAHLITDPIRNQTGINLHAGVLTEGQGHDFGKEHVARSG